MPKIPERHMYTFYDTWTKMKMARHIIQGRLSLEDPAPKDHIDVKVLLATHKLDDLRDMMWDTKKVLDQQFVDRYDKWKEDYTISGRNKI